MPTSTRLAPLQTKCIVHIEAHSKAALPKTTTSEIAFLDDFISKASLNQDSRGLYPAKLTLILAEGCKSFAQKLKTKRRSPEKQALTESIDELRDITSYQTAGLMHEIYYSPIKKYCSIKTLSSPPFDWLNMTWLLAKQAVCVSGTLELG